MARILFLMLVLLAGAAEAVTDTFTVSGTWTAPAGVTSVTVEAWGGGGGGGAAATKNDKGGGGAGGQYARKMVVAVTPGSNYAIVVGAGGAGGIAAAGGAGGDSTFAGTVVVAKGGAGGGLSSGADGVAGLGSVTGGVGDVVYAGGNGSDGVRLTGVGGAGGGGAGSTGAGGSAAGNTAGTGTAIGGGTGGAGLIARGTGNAGVVAGGGGGGGYATNPTSQNGGAGATGRVDIVYTLPSTVVSINCAAACTTNAASVSWTVTFNTAVTGVTSGNFALVNSGLGGMPAITSVTGSGTTWTVTASTGSGSGTLGLNMTDTTGVTPALSNLPFSGQVHTLDRAVPAVSSIVRVDPTPTALASVSWTVTFSEAVTGVDTTDFALAQTGGVSGALITAVTPVSGTVYTVSASTGTGNGTLGLNLADNDSIVDAVGNPLGGAGAGNGDFTGEAYSIAKPIRVTASPTVCTSVAGIGAQPWTTTTPNDPLASDNLYATATVDGTTTNYLQCTGYNFAIPASATINGITVNVERMSDSTGNGGSNDAAMRIVKGGAIGATDRVTTTIYTTADVVDAHGGATDLWGDVWTAADINAANFGAAFAATKTNSAGPAHLISVDHVSISVDYTVPSSVISIACASACTTNAASVSWTVTFSESVSGVTAGNFALVNTGLGGVPAITSVTGSSTTWTVTASTGTGSGSLGLNMANATGVTPAPTNLPFAGDVHILDRAAPTVSSIVRVDPTPTAQASVSWTVTFGEDVAGVDAGDFVLVQSGGASGALITAVTPVSNMVYTVSASTGVSNGTLGLNLVDNDTIIDTVGNPLGGAGVGNGDFTGETYTLNFTAPSFVFTDSPCVHNIALGAPGQTCTLVTWSPQVAGQNSAGIYITAVSPSGIPARLHASQVKTIDMQFGLTCHNPVAHAGIAASFAGAASFQVCQPNGGTPATWSAIVTVTFNAGSPSSAVSYIFNYADVGKVELWMRNSATPTQVGYSGPFVVKPGNFVLSGVQQTAAPNLVNPAAADAAGAAFVKAGEAFSATVTATTCSPASATCTLAGVVTPNYGKETPAEGVRFVDASLPSTDLNYANHGTLVAGLGLTNNPEIGGTFGAFTNGVATGTAFSWNEAGIITLTPSVADADYLGVGDVTGTASGNIGRFHAAQLALSGGVIANRTGLAGCAAPAGCGTFTYMGEQMSAVFNLTAKAADGATTLQNYVDAFAKLDPTIAGALNLGAIDNPLAPAMRTPLGTRIGTAGLPAATGKFLSTCTPTPACLGMATVTAPFMITRGSSADGPYASLDIGVAPVDSDGTALTYDLDTENVVAGTPNHTLVGATRARYGRMKISNAHGSELLNLPIPMEVQYWQGQYWAQNSLDDTTAIVLDNIKLSNVAVTIGGVTKDAAGKWRIVLNKPSAQLNTDICLDLDIGATGDISCQATTPLSMPYLQTGTAFDKDPSSRATFGVYKGNNEFIYLRETY